MEIANKEELVTILTDLQGQVANMQETIDKLAPAKEEEGKEEGKEEEEEKDLSEEEVSDIDKMLE